MHFPLVNPTEYTNFCLIPNHRRQIF